MNPFLIGFRCTTCDATYAPGDVRYNCPRDGGNLDAVYDYTAIARQVNPLDIANDPNRSAWHYAPLLPLTLSPPHPLSPLSSFGWSPLYRATGIEQALGVRAIWLKDDARLPSSSFKDRASALVIANALQTGVTTICAASTGNAASSLATLCAGTGIRVIIFVPQSTPEGKLAQILVHGARVYAVSGSYDDAFELALQASQAFGWYNRNTGYNPLTREGKKTAAFEICEQLKLRGGEGVRGRRGEEEHPISHAAMLPGSPSPSLPLSPSPALPLSPFRAPDIMVVPVGDGNIISGLHKGCKDLLALGWIDHMPRFIGVTATLAPALYRAWQSNTEHLDTVPSTTIASGISVDLPRDGIMALRAIRETSGMFVEVSDAEMLDAMGVLARDAAVFSEPASAAAYAGLVKAQRLGAIRGDDEVVLQLTGSGLKDVKSALAAVGNQVVRIEGRLEEIRD
ncbi:MAG: threonine synthase [Chloroflexi bacterium]|nr:threonine synthase [Chloroflexota bacterium]